MSNVHSGVSGTRWGRIPRDQVRINRRRCTGDHGQTAIVLVSAVAIVMATFGIVMATTSIDTNPLIQADEIQHYSYRAPSKPVSTRSRASSTTIPTWPTVPRPSTAMACAPASNTRRGMTCRGPQGVDGVIPEYYLVDNPQPQIAANGSLTSLNVEIIGAAGFPGHFVYQTIMGEFQPVNGYLGNVWWSDFAGSNPEWFGHGISTHKVHLRSLCR